MIITTLGVIGGTHYNMVNLIAGFRDAKDKSHAVWCLLPYVQFFTMLFACSYSQFFAAYGAYFIMLVGFYLTYVTAILNLNSTADMKFDWLFYEPFAFAGIVYLDANRMSQP